MTKLGEVNVDGVVFRVGDVVRMVRSAWALRIEDAWHLRIEDLAAAAPPEAYPWAEFTPVKRDGSRDRRKTPFSGPLKGYEKVA